MGEGSLLSVLVPSSALAGLDTATSIKAAAAAKWRLKPARSYQAMAKPLPRSRAPAEPHPPPQNKAGGTGKGPPKAAPTTPALANPPPRGEAPRRASGHRTAVERRQISRRIQRRRIHSNPVPWLKHCQPLQPNL